MPRTSMCRSQQESEVRGFALMRLHQCSRDRRYPIHLALFEIGLVYANDGDRSLCSPLVSVGDGRANEHLVQVFLLPWVDDLGDLQPFGKKAYSPVNLVQTTFSIDVVAIFRSIEPFPAAQDTTSTTFGRSTRSSLRSSSYSWRCPCGVM